MGAYRIRIELTLQGPVLTKASSPGAPGIDAPVARSRHDRTPVLPGSLVKGRIAHAWRDLLDVAAELPTHHELDAWLGSSPEARSGPERTHLAPRRGWLRFEDLLAATPEAPGTPTVTRIRLDPRTGAVRRGALQAIEAPFAAGTRVRFDGHVDVAAPPGTDLGRIARAVELALRWNPGFGACTTSGFGRTLDARATVESGPAAPLSPPAASRWVRLRLQFDRPVCVDARRVARNLFEGSEVVPGGVLRGALASLIQQEAGLDAATPVHPSTTAFAPSLVRAFDRLRFTPAYPAGVGASPARAIPRSIGFAGSRGPLDFTAHADPVVFVDERQRTQIAPRFSSDWKDDDWGKARAKWRWPELRRVLRTRTAIDASRRRAATGQLFSYESVSPDGVEWVSTLDLSAIAEAERDEVLAELSTLLVHGLPGIGKTKATARIAFEPAADPAEGVGGRGPWTLVLTAPALLCDPRALRRDDGDASLALRVQYRAYVHEASSGRLELSHTFAHQSLAGGYLARRYGVTATGEPRPYNPFLRTDPGSVFVLRPAPGVAENHALDALKTWLRTGLPLPRWAVELYGDDWRTCPFRREDGFGSVELPEIRVGVPAPQEVQRA